MKAPSEEKCYEEDLGILTVETKTLTGCHKEDLSVPHEEAVCQKWSKLVAGANGTIYVGATFQVAERRRREAIS